MTNLVQEFSFMPPTVFKAHAEVLEKAVSDSRHDPAEAPAQHTCISSAGLVCDVSVHRL